MMEQRKMGHRMLRRMGQQMMQEQKMERRRTLVQRMLARKQEE